MLYQKEFLSVLLSLHKHHTLYISVITRVQRAEYTFNHIGIQTQNISYLGEKGGKIKNRICFER